MQNTQLNKQSGQYQVKRNDSFNMRNLNHTAELGNHFQFDVKSEIDKIP